MVGAIGSGGVSPGLQAASLLFGDLGWPSTGVTAVATGVSNAPGWLTTLDSTGLPGAAASSTQSGPPGWLTTLDAAGAPQVPASLQPSLGQQVDLRL